MARQAVEARPPWADRWTEPTLEQLIEPLGETHRKPFTELIKAIDEFEQVERSMFWYGVSWKWTLHYQLFDAKGKPLGTLCYLVPKHDAPMICVPMSADQVHSLPIKRLNKMVRDGIRSAKCAIATHWAIWTPTSQSDVTHLTDLIKRLRKHALAGSGSNGTE